jgi:hypothetical protein
VRWVESRARSVSCREHVSDTFDLQTGIDQQSAEMIAFDRKTPCQRMGPHACAPNGGCGRDPFARCQYHALLADCCDTDTRADLYAQLA